MIQSKAPASLATLDPHPQLALHAFRHRPASSNAPRSAGLYGATSRTSSSAGKRRANPSVSTSAPWFQQPKTAQVWEGEEKGGEGRAREIKRGELTDGDRSAAESREGEGEEAGRISDLCVNDSPNDRRRSPLGMAGKRSPESKPGYTRRFARKRWGSLSSKLRELVDMETSKKNWREVLGDLHERGAEQALRALPVMRGQSEAIVAALLEHTSVVSLLRYSELYLQGRPISTFYVLLQARSPPCNSPNAVTFAMLMLVRLTVIIVVVEVSFTIIITRWW
ncbi:MAG: hypothetical protein SGPRY_005595 [Prymnesium sp.]